MSKLSVEPKKNIHLLKLLTSQLYPNNPVLADLTVCQAILEAGLLNSPPSQLAFKYNNLFGIKGKGTAGTVHLPTKEYIKSKWITVKEPFAFNLSVEDSLEQHKKLFENGTRDRPDRYRKVLEAKTLEEAAEEVWKAGYATDKDYTSKLIATYNRYVKSK